MESRREEIVLSRLRIGHTYFTHNHLMDGRIAPLCSGCDCPFTVQHILIECYDFSLIRRKYFNCSSLRELFNTVKPSLVFAYLKEIGLFYRI